MPCVFTFFLAARRDPVCGHLSGALVSCSLTNTLWDSKYQLGAFPRVVAFEPRTFIFRLTVSNAVRITCCFVDPPAFTYAWCVTFEDGTIFQQAPMFDKNGAPEL